MTAIHLDSIHLSAAEREHLGKAVFRGLCDLYDHDPEDVDCDWEALRIPAWAWSHESFGHAGIEVVNSLLFLPKPVREHIAMWLQAYGEEKR